MNVDAQVHAFRVEQVSQDGGCSRLALHGDLDADGAPVLATELDDRLRAGERQIDLDFRGVHFISSAGVGSLIAGIGEFRDEGGDVTLNGLSVEHRKVFEILGLRDYVNL